MPAASRWFVRAALLHLLVGFTLGALLLMHKGVTLNPGIWRLLAPHLELLLVGWIIQLTMGIAFWILPRFSRGSARGNELTVWLAFLLLNAGVLAAGFAPALDLPGWVWLSGRGAEAGSALLFAIAVWSRVKPTEIAASDR